MSDPGTPFHHGPDGRFRNLPGAPERTATAGDMLHFLLRQMTSVRAPQIPAGHVLRRADVLSRLATARDPSVTWLGHAAFILRMGGRVVLTDPFLGNAAGPFGFGPKRLVPPALTVEELPPADVMLISHSHYDHLDARTISAYPHKTSTRVIVPLGLRSFFTRRGYRHVSEQDWWQTRECDGLRVTALPAAHFTKRGLFDRNRTLWASFAIACRQAKVWFSGDTARADFFPDIGRNHGPFDLALIGIGAYEPRSIMRSVHATPEEAVEIARAVRARQAIGMHWGTIMLTPENPFDAPIRFRQAAVDQGYGGDNAWTLAIGETRTFANAPAPPGGH